MIREDHDSKLSNCENKTPELGMRCLYHWLCSVLAGYEGDMPLSVRERYLKSERCRRLNLWCGK